MKILVLNSGSSSLKFQLFTKEDLSVIASGAIEEIGTAESKIKLSFTDSAGCNSKLNRIDNIKDHRAAILMMTSLLKESGTLVNTGELIGVGHRVVHGGEYFYQPTLINKAVIDAVEELIPLAPLHNPANLTGIKVTMEHVGDIPQVAVFDTAFHQSIPEHAYLYALPYDLYKEKKVRRYGFHGTSHSYVAQQAASHLNKPIEELNIITLHLGNGTSAAAIQGGKCIDTSMGMTPLEGLIMGTRSGDIDPAILFYLSRENNMNIDELDSLLNKESGLKGICGTNYMGTISKSADNGDHLCQTARTMFCYRLKKYIGSYIAALGGVDCIVFTGGIGENCGDIRALTCQGLKRLGISLNEKKNDIRAKKIVEIHDANSKIDILIIPTNEEYEIARQTLQVINAKEKA